MTIKLYNNLSDNRVVHKQLTNEKTITGELQTSVDRSRPRFRLENVSITSYNYAYIPDFERYYYINNIASVGAEDVVIELSVDVLMSFWDSFKQSQVIARRSTSNYNVMIADDCVTHSPQPQYIYRKLPFNFTPSENGYCYLLTLGG